MDFRDIPFGVHLDMPAAQYHALPGASPSRLEQFHGQTPAEARLKIEEPMVPSVFMKIGTLGHQRLLEPDRPLQNVVCFPDKYPAEKGEMKDWHASAGFCKAWKKTQEDLGNVCVPRKATKSSPGFDDLEGIVTAILAKNSARRYLEGSRNEVSLIDWNEAFQMVVRCRLDCVPPVLWNEETGAHDRLLADVKLTTQQDNFENHAYDMGYHIQAGLNLDLWNSNCGEDDPRGGFVFITVKPTRPYCVKVFRCSREFIERGRRDWRMYLGIYAKCLATGIWPDYEDKEFPLSLPKYVK